jgi:signal transduction histidine kinase
VVSQYRAGVALSSRVRPWMLVSAAWVIPAVFGALNQVAQKRLFGGEVRLPEILFAAGDWLVYAFLTPAVFAVSQRWPIARPHVGRRVAFHIGISLLFCAAWALPVSMLRAVLLPQLLRGGPAASFVSWLFITFPFGVAVYLCVVGIEHATRYFVEARDRGLQLARISEQLSNARLAALQAQVNPHFLFNTLNIIAVLVRDNDRQGAVRIVEQLADLLRLTLRRRPTSEVTLDDELDLVKQYLAIEQARFSDRLRPTFDIDADVRSAAIPGFALQHLVENAVRHGVARRPEADRIHVSARRIDGLLEVSVEDNGPGIAPGIAFTEGHGVVNTRERLRELYGDGASLDVRSVAAHGRTSGAPDRSRGAGHAVMEAAEGTRATLRVPYRERERSVGREGG